MKKRLRILTVAMAIITLVSAGHSQTQNQTDAKTKKSKGGGPVTIQAGPPLVQGSGTIGQIPKWTNFTGINFVLGDSAITESGGNIGIGTTTPGSKLSVLGMIETTLGGYKFPDGTVQTTAAAANALTVVAHDATLRGNGSASSPLGVVPLLTDATLKGNGSSSALGVAVPLDLSGSVTRNNIGVLTVRNSAPNDAAAILVFGGTASATKSGGAGLRAFGGAASTAHKGGAGLEGVGGTAIDGVDGGASGRDGGFGGFFLGGSAGKGSGGVGAHVEGGFGKGAGNRGGTGLEAGGGSGLDGATLGLAGDFFGDVAISGNLSKGGGSFKIDHPLDPENKYLYHSFVESPDMKNIYDGTVTTDANGDATVTLPDWFEALNQDFRYQLTVIDTFAQAIVVQKIKGNHFIVKTNAPNVEVCWLVTGTRHDAYANKHRIPVEEQKPEEERGLYLHPDAFNKPEDRGVQFVRNAPQIERANAARERATPQQQR